MTGPHPATAAIRYAVRAALADCSPDAVVLAAVSGGADSLALAAALAFERARRGLPAAAVVVDHGLQEGSAVIAAHAADECRVLGLAPVEVVTVDVVPSPDGLEAAARDARYAALDASADRLGACCVLVGHTLDDQAEQVLLGLARGSGTRSLAGMPPARGRVRRPLLGISREQTRASCTAEGISWWDDPMNDDPAFARVRARRAVADLERDLGPGVVAALARSAEQLREDADLLDALADDALADLLGDTVTGPGPSVAPDRSPSAGAGEAVPQDRSLSLSVDVAAVTALPRPVRTRVWRRLLIAAGAPSGEVSTRHTDECDRLLTAWHGQGPLHVPGDLRVARRAGRVRIEPATGDR